MSPVSRTSAQLHSEPHDPVRITHFWPAVAVLATPVALGLLIFLRRYRGTDRTAVVLAVLVAVGVVLVLGLAWFQLRWGGSVVSQARLRSIGFRTGGLAGLAAGPISILLLGIRWAVDQLGGPVGERFAPAFIRALSAMTAELVTGLPAFAALSLVLGALAGLGVAEIMGAFLPRQWSPPPRTAG